MNVSETNTFTRNVTGETYEINHKLTCDDNCLIYLQSCKCCEKQYVGETTDSFRDRWNNYKDSDRKYSRNIFYFSWLIYFIYYGFLRASSGSSVLIELHVDGMQFYQQ